MSKKSIHLYNDDTIDGKSRNIAYTLWGSKLVADKDVGKVKALQQIHAYLFGGKKKILTLPPILKITNRVNGYHRNW